jgi:inner membrane protein
VDNITHAFIGAAMAECAVPRSASPRARTVFMCAGVIASNAPDVDLLYSGVIEEPLGYLLHHRGHSHTLPGIGVLGFLIWAGLRLLPQPRLAIQGMESRWLALVAAGLVGHVLMDTANGYGTHLWYPFWSGWVYGDAVFVLEPWLWAIFGATLALNAGRIWRVLIALLTLVPIGALIQIGLLPAGVAAAVLAVVGAAAVVVRRWPQRTRAAAALAATAAIVVAMSGISRAAKDHARRTIADPSGGAVIDITADANPAVPWCWAVLVLQQAADRSTDALVARRATLSLLPGIWPAESCASARLGVGWSTETRRSADFVLHRQWTIDVEGLRALYAGNCRARAWLQFGRVPSVSNGSIVDLRFENPIGQNFTPMALDAGRECPKYVTHWEWPRRDVLTAPLRSP